MKFSPGKVDEWLDCGNKNATVYSNQRVLENTKSELSVSSTCQSVNSLIVQPCYIGENVRLTNCKIGPFVSIGENSNVTNSSIKNSLIQTNVKIINANLDNAMIGNYATYNGKFTSVSIGDYTELT